MPRQCSIVRRTRGMAVWVAMAIVSCALTWVAGCSRQAAGPQQAQPTASGAPGMGGPQVADLTVAPTIAKVLVSSKDARKVTASLIALLDGENSQLASAAADELLKRDLTYEELKRLGDIAARVPFRDYGGMRPPGDPSNASGKHAWRVLKAKVLPRLSLEGRIGWLVEWMRLAAPDVTNAAGDAARILADIGAPAVPRLTAELEGGGIHVQTQAAWALMSMGTDEAFRAVERWALPVVEATPDQRVCESAARWLSLLQSRAAFEPLVRVMWAHLDEAGTWGLIGAVQDTGQERAIPELAKVLDAPAKSSTKYHMLTYLSAAQALAELGDGRGREALRAAVTSPDLALRQEVPWHLACLGKAKQRQLLERLAQGPDRLTAGRAQMMLRDVVNAQPIRSKPARSLSE